MGQYWSQRLGPAVTSPMYWLFHLNDTCEANLVWSYGDVGPPCGADKRGLGLPNGIRLWEAGGASIVLSSSD